MKTLEDLRDFYNTTLLTDLKVLEQQRQKITLKLTYILAVMLCILGVCFLFLQGNINAAPLFILIPAILCFLIGALLYTLLTRNYVARFKTLVIQRIIHFIDENLNYDANNFIDSSTFVSSKIFNTKPNCYKGDDLVWGKVGATEIKFSEINAEYESGSGKDRHRYTIFKGLFFIGDFNKHFTSRAVVLPDTAEKLFGH